MTAQHPFEIDDLYQLGWLEDPRISPDGGLIAYVHVTVDRQSNRYRRAIWLAPTNGGRPRRFTAGTKSDTSPRWSPDGRRLAFVSTRANDKPQIFVISIDGGEARCVTSMRQGASEPAWSPDGRQIAFLSSANQAEREAEDSGVEEPPPADEWEHKQNEERRTHEEEQRFDPRVLNKLPYRSGTSFFDDRHQHIYVIGLNDDDDNEDNEKAKPRRLTDGDLHHSAPVWMPDGQSILTTAIRDPELDSLFAYSDVVRVPVPPQSRAGAQRLTSEGYSYFAPQPSPDGKMIAVLRMPEDRLFIAGTHLAVIPAAGGASQGITEQVDLNIEQFHWMPKGDGLLYLAGWRGAQPIYQALLDRKDSSQGRAITDEHRSRRIISGFDVAPDGSIAFIAESPESPSDLVLRRPNGQEIRLTAINHRLLEQRRVVPIEELSFSAPDGKEVQGWLLYPPDFDPTQNYPLAVYIHGGPHIMWGPGFRSMWHEWQTAAAQGYIVFFCNPRGSEGYGERWRGGIHANWGVADAPDIHAGIDAVIARGNVDPSRIAVTGGSYGGYMTTWLIGHSKRFACAVAARGVYNLLSQYSTSDAHELIETEFGKYPWEMHDKLWQHSPLAHAHKITTPLLILHSEQDYRVSISEAEQLFTYLRRRKQIVEFVRYPREGHELTRTGEPRHRADHMRRTLAWFDRFCKSTIRPSSSDQS